MSCRIHSCEGSGKDLRSPEMIGTFGLRPGASDGEPGKQEHPQLWVGDVVNVVEAKVALPGFEDIFYPPAYGV